MADDGIPAELRDFIIRSIDTVGQLEALLLLRAHAEETWDPTRLAQRLYVNETEAAAIMVHLVGQGLATVQDGTCRYSSASKQSETVDRLAEAYARQLIPITNLIHTKPRGIRAFADAFKIKRDK